MRTFAKLKRGPVPERRSDEPWASQAAPAPYSGFVCERTAPSVHYPVPDALGMPLKPNAVHDPAPTGGVGTFRCQVKYDPRGAPTRAKSSKWFESMLGRSQFNPPPTVQESIAAASAQPHVSSDAFRNIPPPHAHPSASNSGHSTSSVTVSCWLYPERKSWCRWSGFSKKFILSRPEFLAMCRDQAVRTKLSKMAGNAFTVTVVQCLLQQLLPAVGVKIPRKGA